MRSPETQEYTFGPAISVDINLADEYKPLNIDLAAISRNLQKDFPELTQEDWDYSRVLLASGLGRRLGGFSSNLLDYRRSGVARKMTGLGAIAQRLAQGTPRASRIDKLSGGKEVLAMVNLSYRGNGRGHAYMDKDDEMNSSVILGHELKHTADNLLSNQNMREVDVKKINRHTLNAMAHLSVIATGVGLAISSGLETMYMFTTNEWNARLAELDGASAATGIALVAAPVYAILKKDSLSAKRFGYTIPPEIYKSGEDATCAYTVATRSDWEGTVSSTET